MMNYYCNPLLFLWIVLLLGLVGLSEPFSMTNTPSSFSSTATTTTTTMSVRFSLYPMLHQDKDETVSMRQVIKHAVHGLADLGLDIQADDVSSCLTSSTNTQQKNSDDENVVVSSPSTVLFEAIRVSFGRAAKNEQTNQERQINLVCTFSKGMSSSSSSSSTPTQTKRTVNESLPQMVPDAYKVPRRIVAQFSIYPLGGGAGGGSGSTSSPSSSSSSANDIIQQTRNLAKQSNCWKTETDNFCNLLDGDGNQVMEVLQSCFDLATKLHDPNGPLAMSCTLTANKRMWNKNKIGEQ